MANKLANALALEALKEMVDIAQLTFGMGFFQIRSPDDANGPLPKAIRAIAALEAEAVQEPVAWAFDDLNHTPHIWWSKECPAGAQYNIRALYATPQQPTPDLDKLRAINAELVEELKNIARADPSKWETSVRDDFQLWAQSRAVFALRKATS